MTGPEVTAAIKRGVKAFMWADETGTAGETVTGILSAALNGPADGEGMDDMTMAAHIAICEDSPNECLENRGPCVKAVEAARATLIGEGS